LQAGNWRDTLGSRAEVFRSAANKPLANLRQQQCLNRLIGKMPMASERYATSKQLLKSAALAPALIALCAFATAGGTAEEAPSHDDEQQALALVQQFAGQLKPRLQGAISEGGPVHAIQVCASEAPKIAADLSARSGWKITRVSSRNRNPDGAPDPWEAAAITHFESQLEAGADPATLKLGEITREGYRFAKPQVTEPLCLTCHGQTLAPEVSKALASHYPEDRATGYQAGQLRGIFSLTKPP
jgi:hypothetical protein